MIVITVGNVFVVRLSLPQRFDRALLAVDQSTIANRLRKPACSHNGRTIPPNTDATVGCVLSEWSSTYDATPAPRVLPCEAPSITNISHRQHWALLRHGRPEPVHLAPTRRTAIAETAFTRFGTRETSSHKKRLLYLSAAESQGMRRSKCCCNKHC